MHSRGADGGAVRSVRRVCTGTAIVSVICTTSLPVLGSDSIALAIVRTSAQDVSSSWSVTPSWSATAGTTQASASPEPWIPLFGAVHLKTFSQSRALVDVTTSIRYDVLGPEGAGSQASLRAQVGRSFGRAYLAWSGTLGQAFGPRRDVDFESGSLLFMRVGDSARVGGEVRVRGELVERFVTVEDEGRPLEVVAGAALGLELRPLFARVLAGWSWPRGLLPAGPLCVGSTTLRF